MVFRYIFYFIALLVAFSLATDKQQKFKRDERYCLQQWTEAVGLRTRLACMEMCMSGENTCTALVYMVYPSETYCMLSWALGRYCEGGNPAYRAVGICPDSYIYNPHSDTCLRLMETAMTWEDANSTCHAANEYLVTFPTAASSQWLREKATELSSSNAVWNEVIWIGGLNATGDNYRWQGLQTAAVPGNGDAESDWAVGEPNLWHELCMGLHIVSDSISSGWLDVPCTFQCPFICEAY